MKYIDIPTNTFKMGTNDDIGFSEDYEGPQVSVKVKHYKISETTVTNADYKEFVNKTGYKTLAERKQNSFVFSLLLPEEERKKYPHVAGAPWWLVVPDADWAHPFGKNSTIDKILDHPVVHVALEDAIAYCNWAGVKLPTEAQWECAAKAGTQTTYPWGTKLVDDKFHANTWQGNFPWENTEEDGFLGTAPVKTYEPNNWGLYQMIGNVWEWCRNLRYVPLTDFNDHQFKVSEKPTGEYAIRGGSFLCHCSYCNRYRSAARNGVDCTSTASHLSFRVIKEL